MCAGRAAIELGPELCGHKSGQAGGKVRRVALELGPACGYKSMGWTCGYKSGLDVRL